MKHQIFSNTIVQVLSKAIGVGFSLLLTIIITKNLGVYQFGELIKTISFVAIFYMPIDFGLNAAVLRIFNQHPDQKQQIVSQLNIIRTVLATILLASIFIIVNFLPDGQLDGFTPLVKQSILILSLTLYIQSLIRTTNSIFQHLLLYKYTLATELLQGIVTLIATYVAINTTKNITPIIIGYLIGGSLSAMVQFVFACKFIQIRFTQPDYKLIKQLLLKSIPLGLVIIISTIHTKTDILLLTNFRTTAEVGVFGLVKRIFESLLTIPLFFSNSLYPVLLNQPDKKIIKQSVFVMLLTSLFIATITILASPLLVLIKPEFEPSVPLLRYISLTLPLFFITAPLMWKMVSNGQQTILIWIYLQALLVNLCISLILIPTLGAVGGIIGLAISETTTLLCLIYFTSKNYEQSNR